MRLNVLAGAAGLLRPAVLDLELVTRLFGPEVRLAPAGWLDLETEPLYHDFLRDESGSPRIESFARALHQDFGARLAPLIVLPDLLSEAARPGGSPEGRLSGLAVLERLWAHGGADVIRLSAIALPAAGPEGIWAGAETLLAPAVADALADLGAACVAGGMPGDAVETQLVEIRPEGGGLAAPWHNALAARLAAHLGDHVAAAALTLDPGPAQAALVRLLGAWSCAGIEPAFDPRREDFARLAGHALSGLLAGAADG